MDVTFHRLSRVVETRGCLAADPRAAEPGEARGTLQTHSWYELEALYGTTSPLAITTNELYWKIAFALPEDIFTVTVRRTIALLRF